MRPHKLMVIPNSLFYFLIFSTLEKMAMCVSSVLINFHGKNLIVLSFYRSSVTHLPSREEKIIGLKFYCFAVAIEIIQVGVERRKIVLGKRLR